MDPEKLFWIQQAQKVLVPVHKIELQVLFAIFSAIKCFLFGYMSEG
jgi:hypothetical protein